jgi:hypothetical protein
LKLDRNILNEARLKHLKTLKTLYKLIQTAEKQPQDKDFSLLAEQARSHLKAAIADKGEFSAATRAVLESEFKFVLYRPIVAV